jgi:hypothetical protein
MKEKIISFLTLFTSTGTLLCCAVPAAIATAAGGAAIGAYVSTFPWVVPVSQHKGWIFLTAGLLIAVSSVLTLRPQGRLACALTGGRGCEAAGQFSRVMLWVAISIYGIGAFTTYGLTPILRHLEG